MNNKKTLRRTVLFPSLLIFIIALVSGCSDNGFSVAENNNGGGNGNDNVSLSIKTDNSTDNPPSIIIDEAKALINEVEAEQEPSGAEQHIRIAPFVVHFNMNGTLITVTSGNIPSGLYNKIKFKVHKPEDNETPPDPEFKEGSSGSLRYSFIIKGRYNGVPFVYKSRKSANLVLIFPYPISLQEAARNITVLINPSLWFFNGSGQIDPRDPNHENEIDDYLKNSFKRAFKDDNKDGRPDDN